MPPVTTTVPAAASGADNFATTPAFPTSRKARSSGISGGRNWCRPVAGTLHISKSTTHGPKPPSKRKTRWRDLSENEKLQASIESAGRLRGLAWSLNLGIGRENALANTADPARLLSQYLSREFRHALGHDLPSSFVLEIAQDEHGGRLHAHGVVVTGDANLEHVKEALCRAGGKIEDRAWSAKQLRMKPLTDVAGWCDYLTKNRRWGKALPSGRPVFINRPLKQIAKSDYEEFGLSRRLSFDKPRKPKKKPAENKVKTDLTHSNCSSILCFMTGQLSGYESRFRAQTKETRCMKTETYIPDALYRDVVKLITASLNRAYARQMKRYPRPVDSIALYDNAHAAARVNLGPAGIDLGTVAAGDGIARPEHFADLVQALADLRPDVYEEIDLDQVKMVLGEIGNIWPEYTRPDDEHYTATKARLDALTAEHRRATLDAAREGVRRIREGVAKLAMLGCSIPRDQIDALHSDYDRQARASVEGLPQHMRR